MEFKIKIIEPIWTGGVAQNDKTLHETGLIGSLRWWYEALIRGLGGYACDSKACKCKVNSDTADTKQAVKEALEEVCLACQMFGCTGWSKKFSLRIYKNNELVSNLKDKGEITLELLEIKPFTEEEKWLWAKIFKIISDYGSLGGKTIYKPSDYNNNHEKHHKDYGLIKLDPSFVKPEKKYKDVQPYIASLKKIKTMNSEWPNLKYFWFIPKFTLERDKFNLIVNRSPKNIKPNPYLQGTTPEQRWLGGDQNPAASKKIFSFHSSTANRTWGYTKANGDEYEKVMKLLKNSRGINIAEVIRGDSIISKELE